MKKVLSRAAAATVGMALPALALAQNYYDDYYYEYDYGTSDEAAAAVGVLMLVIAGFAILFGLAFFIFWVVMVIDLINRDFDQKGTWTAIMAISFFLGLNWLSAIVYYFMVKRKNLGTKKGSGGAPQEAPKQPEQTPPQEG